MGTLLWWEPPAAPSSSVGSGKETETNQERTLLETRHPLEESCAAKATADSDTPCRKGVKNKTVEVMSVAAYFLFSETEKD